MSAGSELRPEVERYAERLLALGRDEREVARAALYAQRYGLETLSRDQGCVIFAKPDCGDWNCLNPEHQTLESGS